MTAPPPARLRPAYALLLVFTIALGLGSRRGAALLPPLLAKNTGDILYATMIFWLGGWLFPRAPSVRLAWGAFAVCAAIEFAKLIQAPWLVSVRHSRAGALVLGVGFHASNLACYALGAGLGLAVERLISARAARKRPKERV